MKKNHLMQLVRIGILAAIGLGTFSCKAAYQELTSDGKTHHPPNVKYLTMSAATLASEHEQDFERDKNMMTCKQRYSGKWFEVTGIVTHAVKSPQGQGYIYLKGSKEEGFIIYCQFWPDQADVCTQVQKGQTVTVRGQYTLPDSYKGEKIVRLEKCLLAS